MDTKISFLEEIRKKTSISETHNIDRYIKQNFEELQEILDSRGHIPECCEECILHSADVLKSLQKCHNNQSCPYIISFFDRDKYEKPLRFMLVSENPNWYNKEISENRKPSEKQRAKNDKRITRIDELGKRLEEILKIKNGFFSIFYDKYRHSKQESSIDTLMESSNKFSTYWAHIVKCYAWNMHDIVNCAFENCREILKAEIEHLHPRIIITLGNVVYRKTCRVIKESKFGYECKDESYKKEKIITPELLGKLLSRNKECVISLPHPSPRNLAYVYCRLDDGIVLKKGPKC